MTYMERALSLARQAVGSVSPNPAVGAVVVNNGVVVGEGFTQPPGQAHAEVVALRQAGDKASGGTLYTTLEPCSHFGRTPPCTVAIVEAGISEVHAAILDPNPIVNGRGVAQFKEAGIRTCLGEGEQEARRTVEAYAKFVTTGFPFVTAKYAMSLDGKIATHTGDSQWITGEEARAYVHQMRAASDAIVVGINTVLSDDPRLTARDGAGRPRSRQPMRVLVDSRGRTPTTAKLLSEPGQTLVAVARADDSTRDALTQAGAEVVSVPAAEGEVDLQELLRLLGCRNVTSVLVEGGGTLLGSFFDLGLVDKVVAFVSPTVVGGKGAPSPVAGVGATKMADAKRLHQVEVIRFGRDLAVVGYCEAVGDVHRDR